MRSGQGTNGKRRRAAKEGLEIRTIYVIFSTEKRKIISYPTAVVIIRFGLPGLKLQGTGLWTLSLPFLPTRGNIDAVLRENRFGGGQGFRQLSRLESARLKI